VQGQPPPLIDGRRSLLGQHVGGAGEGQVADVGQRRPARSSNRCHHRSRRFKQPFD